MIAATTQALIDLLGTSGRPVGDAVAPTSTDETYFVVYQIGSDGRRGTVENPYEDAALIFQVTCVAPDRAGADWLADKAHDLLDSSNAADALSTAGVACTHVEPLYEGGVARDDDTRPPVFYATPRWRVWLTPA